MTLAKFNIHLAKFNSDPVLVRRNPGTTGRTWTRDEFESSATTDNKKIRTWMIPLTIADALREAEGIRRSLIFNQEKILTTLDLDFRAHIISQFKNHQAALVVFESPEEEREGLINLVQPWFKRFQIFDYLVGVAQKLSVEHRAEVVRFLPVAWQKMVFDETLGKPEAERFKELLGEAVVSDILAQR